MSEYMNTNPNIETRISKRAQSVFKALGEVINDFYLEVGIYFIGGFNALLVAWELYTEMVGTGQPQAYAIAIAAVAFTAVEGLTVFLVGAAAKTNSSLLWFFSVCFALFFTYSHYQANSGNGNMGQYISLAIPIFAVVGYMARTMKANVENTQEFERQKLLDGEDRKRQKEDDKLLYEREAEDRKQRLEDEEIAYNRETDRTKSANDQELKLAKLAEKAGKQLENSDWKNDQNSGNSVLPGINSGRKLEKADILERLPVLLSDGYSNVEIGKLVGRNERTIRNYRKQLNGKMEAK
jgi:hypothetical protein